MILFKKYLGVVGLEAEKYQGAGAVFRVRDDNELMWGNEEERQM